MGKIAIVSDIHGNLEALMAVISDIDKQDIQNVYCLGDIVGHIHVPFVINNLGKWHKALTGDMVLKKDEKYLINVGSVGQPRDKNPMACYGILSVGEDNVAFKIQRVFYDIQKTVDAIYKAGLPEYLGNRLLKGE